MIEIRRRYILEHLDGYYQITSLAVTEIERLRKECEQLHENVAREYWLSLELGRHVSAKVLDRILVDQHVHMMDPDFSFAEAMIREVREDLERAKREGRIPPPVGWSMGCS